MVSTYKNASLSYLIAVPLLSTNSVEACRLSPVIIASTIISKISGFKNTFSGIFLLITLLVYPTTWTSDEVQTVCGKEVTEELININVIINTISINVSY